MGVKDGAGSGEDDAGGCAGEDGWMLARHGELGMVYKTTAKTIDTSKRVWMFCRGLTRS